MPPSPQLRNDLAMTKDAKGHLQSVLLWPVLWKKWDVSIRLQWRGKPFTRYSARHIPNSPGVYAFVIHPHVSPRLPCSVLMYIGKSDRPLRDRFREYLREQNSSNGRPAISTMLQMYDGHLSFYCATVTRPATPSQIEERLLEALVPPMNKVLPASIRRIVAAFT
jgi:excinuclease UvrABC nuclease subunit